MKIWPPRRRFLIILFGILLASLWPISAGLAAIHPAQPLAPQISQQPGLLFIENVGQFAEGVRFQVRGVGGSTLWLADNGLWLTLSTMTWRLPLPGAKPSSRLEPFDRLETKVSYYRGSDPARWHTDVPVWGGVRYVDLYPGVDLEITGANGRWTGQLVAHGERLTGSDRTAASSQEELQDLLYSTYFGGSGNDGVYAVAVGPDGSTYVTGQTWSTDLPITPGAVDPDTSGGEAFVARITPDGTGLAYLTYLGGSDAQGGVGVDKGTGIAVDDDGAAHVAGWTNSADFPTTPDAFQSELALNGSNPDAFVAVLEPDGTALRYSTYLGGSNNDKIGYFEEGNPIAVGKDGAIYVVGTTFSADFPATPGAFDPTYNAYPDAFVAVFEPDRSARYVTFLGGSDSNDFGGMIAVGADGAAYVTGQTNSLDFPVTPDAFQTELHSLYHDDAFVTVLAPDGASLRYSTYLGGASADDEGIGIAVAGDGAAYVAGLTWSDDFPTTPGVFQPAYGGGNADGFIAVLDPTADGSASLRHATYLGGDNWDNNDDVQLAADGSVYVAGLTHSDDFPVSPDAYQSAKAGLWDAFVAKLAPDCSTLDYATYLGGGDGDEAYAIAVDAQGAAYVAGHTYSSDFPVSPGAFQPTFGSGTGSHPTDGFVAKLGAKSHYVVSGQALDARAQPIEGARMLAGESYSATTDAGGWYSLTLPAGTYTLTPPSGYFWTPESRVVTTPPDTSGQDFVGRNLYKGATPAGPKGTVGLDDRLTYTLRLVWPWDERLSLYDPLPPLSYTRYVSGSLNRPGLAYDAGPHAISGSLELAAGVPLTLSFAVQVRVAGTAGFAPVIANRACVYPEGGGVEDCQWSNLVVHYTYAWPIYLPVVIR